jgi:REP element-mobilizing transposase RayT
LSASPHLLWRLKKFRNDDIAPSIKFEYSQFMATPKPLLKQAKLPDVLPLGSKIRAKLKANFEPRISHGGLPSIKKRKTARPFSPEAPVHLVLQATRAKGRWSLLHRKNRASVQSMIYVYAARFKVRVYRANNVGNQLHLLVKAKEKKHLADFLRVLAGRIAVVVTGAKKYIKRIGKFWDYLVWSRLIRWGAEFYSLRKFVAEVSMANTQSNDFAHAREWSVSGFP